MLHKEPDEVVDIHRKKVRAEQSNEYLEACTHWVEEGMHWVAALHEVKEVEYALVAIVEDDNSPSQLADGVDIEWPGDCHS